jgi:hypothetical protein
VVPDTVKTSLQQIADSVVRVDVQYLLRPSEDEALRAADIGASGVNEVISLHWRCTSQLTLMCMVQFQVSHLEVSHSP